MTLQVRASLFSVRTKGLGPVVDGGDLAPLRMPQNTVLPVVWGLGCRVKSSNSVQELLYAQFRFSSYWFLREDEWI